MISFLKFWAEKIGKSLLLEKIYDARKALTIFILDALQAGRNPPRNPITVAKIKQFTIIEGLRANPKEISENDHKQYESEMKAYNKKKKFFFVY